MHDQLQVLEPGVCQEEEQLTKLCQEIKECVMDRACSTYYNIKRVDDKNQRETQGEETQEESREQKAE